MMLWRFYQQIMVSHPLRTNCFTALGVMCIGDTTAQLINNEKQNIFEFEVDKPRLLTMLSWNSLCFTPFFFYFFRTVDAIFPGSGLRNVALKVMTTQLSVTIPINVADMANSSPQFFISGNELPKIIPIIVQICQFTYIDMKDPRKYQCFNSLFLP